MVKTAYNEYSVKSSPKATEIKKVCEVKRTRRNGVEGFIIGDKL